MSGNPMLDRDQLQPEDTLVSEPTGDVLDSGYEPADSTQGRRLDASVEEADRDETIEQRLAQEDPEDPQLPGSRCAAGRGATRSSRRWSATRTRTTRRSWSRGPMAR